MGNGLVPLFPFILSISEIFSCIKRKMFLISRCPTIFTFLFFIHCYLVCLCKDLVHGDTPTPTPTPTEIIAINCGSYGNITSLDGRQWIGDANTKFFDTRDRQNGKAKRFKTLDKSDGIPYSTARVSNSHFTYTFHIISGPIFIRLHFNPTSYKGFTRSNAFFTVKTGPYTLLSNFSPSLTADAFGLKSIVKEFSLHIEESKPLRLTFSPSRTCSCDDEIYAFVNGIEVVSMPNTLYYNSEGDLGASVVGQNRRFLIGNSFALETVHRLNIGGISILSTQDTGMFREWSSDSNYLVEFGSSSVSPLTTSSNINFRKIPTFIAPRKVYQTSWAMKSSGFKFSWKLPVDLGFRYMVRFHFCELDYQIKEIGQRKFSLFINDQLAESDVDLIKWAGGHGVAVYIDYIVMMDGDRMEGKHDLLVALYSNLSRELELEDEPIDAILKGLEVFKLSNNDKNLAGVNPVVTKTVKVKPQRFASPFSGRNTIFTLVVLLLILLNYIIYTVNIYREKVQNKIAFPYRPDEKVENQIVFPYPPDEKVENQIVVPCPPDEKVENQIVVPCPPDEKVDDKSVFPYPPDEKVERQIVFPYPVDELCRRFSLAELKLATNNFDDGLVIGKGGFGKVYKGNVEGVTKTVAIKRLSSDSKQGAEEFWTEIGIFSKLQHDHLVTLIGYCDEHKEMILVYENMTRGSLADHLYKSYNDGKGRLGPPLPWDRRLKLCLDAARGLNFLHKSDPTIIHRDVKSTNILLDENWVAKISDFGLCKKFRFSHSCTHVSASLKGTFGYLDPKYFLNGELTMKTDVYAFGVVLWEILCGRPAIDKRFEDEQRSLALWAQSCFEDGIHGQIIDPSLRGQIPVSSLKLISTMANECLHNHLKKRPSMDAIVFRLESALASLNNLDKLADSFDSCVVPKFGSWDDEIYPRYDPLLLGNDELRSNIVSNPEYASEESHQYMNSDHIILQSSPSHDLEQVRINYPTFKAYKSGRVEVKLKIYSLNDMKRATQDFQLANILGEGGFGKVYRGWIDEKTLQPCKPGRGISVAIKKLEHGSKQGLEEWQAEVNLLGRLSSRHPNLVKMYGYCKGQCMVYEFVDNGSLDKHLFISKGGSIAKPLSWDTRLKIAIGAAQGLAFLHSPSASIIMRDVKSSNILLDKNYNAKLSDFGLAKMGPSDESTHITTRVVGTFGYLAPEYIFTGKLTTKSDVFGFGIVLLEILTGMRAWDSSRNIEKQNLIEWAMPYLSSESKIESILDVQIEGQYSLQGVVKAGKIIQRCLESDPKKRPLMNEVVEALNEIATIEGKTMADLHTTPSESSPDIVTESIVDSERTNAAKPKVMSSFRRRLRIFKSWR